MSHFLEEIFGRKKKSAYLCTSFLIDSLLCQSLLRVRLEGRFLWLSIFFLLTLLLTKNHSKYEIVLYFIDVTCCFCKCYGS